MTSQPPSPSDYNPFEPDLSPPKDFIFLEDPLRSPVTNQLSVMGLDMDDDDVPSRESDMMDTEVGGMDTEVGGMDTEIGSDGSPQRETVRIHDAFQTSTTVIAHTSAESSMHYVQGIVQGVHAYLITNLVGDESETLLQPQMVWTLGRNRQVGILLRDSGLSRRHAVIQYITRQGFYMIDLNSMNGTFVNGLRLKQRHLLEDGDRVSLGNTSFVFYTSCRNRTLEAIHPEVLSYLSNTGALSMPVTSQ